MKTLIFFLIFSSLFTNIQASKTHTIYVSGFVSSDNWYKESKSIYNGLKREVIAQGDSIELFPKRKYREYIDRSMCKHRRSRSISKKMLLLKYNYINRLLDELLELIMKRRDEIIRINSLSSLDSSEEKIWSKKIHLKSHGRGDVLLRMLVDKGYGKILGTIISIESTISESSSDSYNERIICLTIDEVIELGTHSRVTDEPGTHSSVTHESCISNHKKLFEMVGVILGIVGGILALI